MQLIMEIGADHYYENYFMSNKFAILMPNKYKKPSFKNIVWAENVPDHNPTRLFCITNSHLIYIFLYYLLLFPHNKPGWS